MRTKSIAASLLASLAPALALLVGLAALAPSIAEGREIEVSFAGGPRFARSASLDAVDGDDVLGLYDLGASLSVMKFPCGQLVFVDLVAGGGTTNATSFDQIESSLALRSLEVGARTTRAVASVLDVHARVAAGVTRGTLRMSFWDRGESQAILDRDYAPSAYAGLGAELHTRRDQPYSVAFRAEVGYELVGPLGFAAVPDTGDDGLAHLDVAAASLGAISTSGLGLRFGVVGRF